MDNITIKQNKRAKAVEINIKDYFTVENLDELRTNIINSLDNKNQLSMHLQAIENIDIGALQFIYALQKEAKQKEINFNLFFNGSEEITSLLKKTGFENFILTNNNNNNK